MYPGIDVVYYGSGAGLEYDFVVSAGTDPGRIRLRFEGSRTPRVDAGGDLLIETAQGWIKHHRPSVYQQIFGKRQKVQDARFVVRDGEVSFTVGEYDKSRELFIDPVLTYATYLGGSLDDHIHAIAIDAAGNVYVAGETWSSNFPTQSAYSGAHPSGTNDDAFVTKLNPTFTTVLFTTFLIGSSTDVGTSICLDASGNVYVGGWTYSSNFPIVGTVFQSNFGGLQDGFVAKLSGATGAVIYSTYLGGSGTDLVTAIKVDSGDNVRITGYTSSTNFPTTSGAYQSSFQGGYYDAFYSILSPTGSTLTYSTYLGGTGSDLANALALGSDGSAYIAGGTNSTNFPLVNSVMPYGGAGDAFVVTFGPSNTLTFATYLGGSSFDSAYAITTDSSGIYVAGSTTSIDFPVTASAVQAVNNGYYDVFVAKISGSTLLYATYLGGSLSDQANGIVVDPSENAYVTGYTYSTDFPTQLGLEPDAGLQEGILFALNPSGSALLYSTYFGGSAADLGEGIVYAGAGAVYVAGSTSSKNFMAGVSAGIHSVSTGTDFDGFVIQVGTSSSAPSLTALSVNPSSGSGLSQSFAFQFSDPSGYASIASAVIEFTGSDGLQCTVYYSQGNSELLLLNDAHSTWLGPIAMGSSGLLQNTTCAITGAGASASGSGNVLTLTIPFTFLSAFSGTRTISVQLTGSNGQSTAMQLLGSWTVLANPELPVAVSVSPSSGSGPSQSFAFQFSDSTGYASIASAVIEITGPDGLQCTILYIEATLELSLLNDAHSAWLGPIALGSSGSLTNTTCGITGAGASASGSGNVLTLTLPLTFTTAFSGSRTISAQLTGTNGQSTPMQLLGAWTVPGVSPSLTPVSVSPASGSGLSQSFVFQFSDSAGYASIAAAAIEFSGSDGLQCTVYYTQGNSELLLFNDAHSAWLGPIAMASPGSLQNTTCSITGKGASASGSGNVLTLTLRFTFTSAFTGSRTISVQLTGSNGQSTAIVPLGSWTP
jgi:hypothetical protein